MSVGHDELTGIQWISDHARDRFEDRSDHHQTNLRAVWYDAAPVDYLSAREHTYARYHLPTDLILLARWGELVTCIDLNDRPTEEQLHVRQQVQEHTEV